MEEEDYSEYSAEGQAEPAFNVNFKGLVVQYLDISNDIAALKDQNKKVKEQIDHMVAALKQRITDNNNLIKERLQLLENIEPYIMEYMQKEDLLELKTTRGIIKFKERNVKQKVTLDVVKERMEKIFDSHPNKSDIISKVFNKEEKKKKYELKCSKPT